MIGIVLLCCVCMALGFSSDAKLQTTRGVRYERSNSTIPTATQAAQLVGVEPPLNASSTTWKRAWTTHRTALPWLHAFDALEPPDSKLALMCLWWKALAANNPQSPVFDDRLHYDLLPPVTRGILGPLWLRRLYPRLHHSNVEIRTAFLDQCVQKVMAKSKERNGSTKIRLVTFGGGYDLRSVKFRARGQLQEAIELDLPEVVESKSKLLTERLQIRRPEITNNLLPSFYKVDFNDVDSVRVILDKIIQNDDPNSDGDDWHTIFVFEAVMIYLDEGVPTALLEAIRKAVKPGGTATLCFADRLENIPGGDMEIGTSVMEAAGWKIVEWQPKPGLARHMGMATPS